VAGGRSRGGRAARVGLHRGFAAAVAAVRANRRGKSTSDVAAELEARLASDGNGLPPELLMWMARDIAEPFWRLRHPLEFLREIRASRRLRAQESLDEPDQLDDEPPNNPEVDALARTLGDNPSVRAVGFSSSTPNLVQVVLDPWSEASVQWVRDVCSPRAVRFVDDLHEW
jgi:hypothetical protein